MILLSTIHQFLEWKPKKKSFEIDVPPNLLIQNAGKEKSIPSGRVLALDGAVKLTDDGFVLQQLVDHKTEAGRL